MLTNRSHHLASKKCHKQKVYLRKIFLHLDFVCMDERFFSEAIHANIVTPSLFNDIQSRLRPDISMRLLDMC